MPVSLKFDTSVSAETRQIISDLVYGNDRMLGLNALGASNRSVLVTVHSDPRKLTTDTQRSIFNRGGNGTFGDNDIIFINPNADYTDTSIRQSILHELVHVLFPGIASGGRYDPVERIELHKANFYTKLAEISLKLNEPMAPKDFDRWQRALALEGYSAGDIARLTKEYGPKCFLAGTPILMADGSLRAIEKIDVGDLVLAFDPDQDNGKGPLVPRRVTRLFRNVTDHVYALPAAADSRRQAGQQEEQRDGAPDTVFVTGGHHVLAPEDGFVPVERQAARPGPAMIDAAGEVRPVALRRIDYDTDTAELFERAEEHLLADARSAALAPEAKRGPSRIAQQHERRRNRGFAAKISGRVLPLKSVQKQMTDRARVG